MLASGAHLLVLCAPAWQGRICQELRKNFAKISGNASPEAQRQPSVKEIIAPKKAAL